MRDNIAKKAIRLLYRNRVDEDGNSFEKKKVNLVYWKRKVNLGDALAPVIVKWMLAQKGLSLEDKTSKTYRLLTIGSVLDLGRFDATVWCSGVQSFRAIHRIINRKYRCLDIRAVRGPISKEIMESCGYDCPEIYGDPAILMPLIYLPKVEDTSKTSIGLGLHHSAEQKANIECDDKSIQQINILTDDYKSFINTITSVEKVISSSLHGIILAEVYGIPAIFFSGENNIEMLKYFDWYRSTKRNCVRYAKTLEEAMDMEPMELPSQEVLDKMRTDIMEVFPYDLWK